MVKFIFRFGYWSMKALGLICLVLTIVAFFATFWKGLYCLGVAAALFIGSQICFVTAEDHKKTFSEYFENATKK